MTHHRLKKTLVSSVISLVYRHSKQSYKCWCHFSNNNNMADNELILHSYNEFLFDTNYQSPWSSKTCYSQILDIEMFLWVFSFDFFYFYKQREWIDCTDIYPIKAYMYCLFSTLPVIHSCAWYVANTLKTQKLGCNEKYPLCLKVLKTIII